MAAGVLAPLALRVVRVRFALAARVRVVQVLTGGQAPPLPLEYYLERIMAKMNAYHVAWATHNSRVSERMHQYRIRPGDAVWLDEDAESKITESIRSSIRKYNIWCLAYNICGYHIHIILVCKAEKLPSVVRTLKSISAREYNISIGITKVGEKSNAAHNRLWARKYNPTILEGRKHLDQTIAYIERNREKHSLPPLDSRTRSLIRDMISSDIPNF